jgi:dihydrolipoamide dehydrogenase
MEKADVIVIGSGQGGVPFADDLAKQGRKVVLFERAALGGSCVNYGCIPSKAFLASAHSAAAARQAQSLGVFAQVRVDFSAIMDRVRGIVRSTNQRVERRLQRAGVHVVRAEASFSGQRCVRGGGVEVVAPVVVINTGKAPLIPGIPGLAGTPYLDYTTFWNLRELPKRILLLGGGYVGIELGQGMARLGSEVHVIDTRDRIVAAEEPEVSDLLAEALKEDGVSLHLGVTTTRVDYDEGLFTLQLNTGENVRGDALLVAAGQKPNTRMLNCAAAGIELDDWEHIKVDDEFRTSNPDIYAIGDVTGQPAFTHVSWEDYRRLMAILDGQSRSKGDRVLGYGYFTEPQVGRAGLTLEQAQQKGFQARAVTLPLDHVARAMVSGRTRGFYRMVIDEKTGKILGATLVGPESAELIHVFIAHMQAGSTWHRLEQSVHIHPTLGEGLPSLARLLC